MNKFILVSLPAILGLLILPSLSWAVVIDTKKVQPDTAKKSAYDKAHRHPDIDLPTTPDVDPYVPRPKPKVMP